MATSIRILVRATPLVVTVFNQLRPQLPLSMFRDPFPLFGGGYINNVFLGSATDPPLAAAPGGVTLAVPLSVELTSLELAHVAVSGGASGPGATTHAGELLLQLNLSAYKSGVFPALGISFGSVLAGEFELPPPKDPVPPVNKFISIPSLVPNMKVSEVFPLSCGDSGTTLCIDIKMSVGGQIDPGQPSTNEPTELGENDWCIEVSAWMLSQIIISKFPPDTSAFKRTSVVTPIWVPERPGFDLQFSGIAINGCPGLDVPVDVTAEVSLEFVAQTSMLHAKGKVKSVEPSVDLLEALWCKVNEIAFPNSNSPPEIDTYIDLGPVGAAMGTIGSAKVATLKAVPEGLVVGGTFAVDPLIATATAAPVPSSPATWETSFECKPAPHAEGWLDGYVNFQANFPLVVGGAIITYDDPLGVYTEAPALSVKLAEIVQDGSINAIIPEAFLVNPYPYKAVVATTCGPRYVEIPPPPPTTAAAIATKLNELMSGARWRCFEKPRFTLPSGFVDVAVHTWLPDPPLRRSKGKQLFELNLRELAPSETVELTFGAKSVLLSGSQSTHAASTSVVADLRTPLNLRYRRSSTATVAFERRAVVRRLSLYGLDTIELDDGLSPSGVVLGRMSSSTGIAACAWTQEGATVTTYDRATAASRLRSGFRSRLTIARPGLRAVESLGLGRLLFWHETGVDILEVETGALREVVLGPVQGVSISNVTGTARIKARGEDYAVISGISTPWREAPPSVTEGEWGTVGAGHVNRNVRCAIPEVSEESLVLTTAPSHLGVVALTFARHVEVLEVASTETRECFFALA